MMMRPQISQFEKFLLVISLFRICSSQQGSDGLCALYSFVPLTLGDTRDGCGDCLNYGISHMIAALMAMEDFNNRNSSIVPQLGQLTANCTAQFDWNKSTFFDTGPTAGHDGVQALVNQPERPCALVGGFHDLPAEELSTMASAYQYPLTVVRAFSLRVIDGTVSTYTNQVYPDIIATSYTAVQVLRSKGRNNYLACLYSLTATGTQWREALTTIMGNLTMTYKAFPFNSSDADSVTSAIRLVKASGYRTILVAFDPSSLLAGAMGKAATNLGLTNGDYVWMFMGNLDMGLTVSKDPNVLGLLKGSLILVPYENLWLESDPFVKSWRSQGSEILERLEPFSSYQAKATSMFNSDFFTQYNPALGSGFMYDAVIATGLGLCTAQASQSKSVEVDATGTTTAEDWGTTFVQNIRSVNFSGVSGPVQFGCPECLSQTIRTHATVTWLVWNMFPPCDGCGDMRMTDIVSGGVVIKVNDTYYANNSTQPPTLRNETESNYLNKGLRDTGLAAMASVWFFSVVSLIWTLVHREHRVLKASQPMFLYAICVGTIISATCILPASFDESYGMSEKQLSRLCISLPWFSLGFIITNCALFAKLWRINKVLQMVRRKVEINQVLWPCALLVVAAVTTLTIWTTVDPLEWDRHEINAETGETIGKCTGDHIYIFGSVVFVIEIIPVFLMVWMAYRTKDVDEAFSESRWIFIMMLSHTEMLLFVVPAVALLRDVSANGRYMGYVVIIWTFPMSTLALVFLPKVMAYRRIEAGTNAKGVRGRSKGAVMISGLPSPSVCANVSTTTENGKSGTLHVI